MKLYVNLLTKTMQIYALCSDTPNIIASFNGFNTSFDLYPWFFALLTGTNQKACLRMKTSLFG